MPEIPDVVVYLEALTARVLGQTLERIRLASPFVLRTVDPALGEAAGKRVQALQRLGKRLVFSLDNDVHVIVHLMIAGRLHWKERGAAALAAHHRGGLEVLEADEPAFRAALLRENHTLKRALTDPRLFSGIG